MIGIHKKKRTVVSLEESSAIFYQVHENRLETFQVNRNQHGYLEIRVHSDAEFLVLKKPRVTDEMFVGSICDVEYYIVAEKCMWKEFWKDPSGDTGTETIDLYGVCHD